MNEEMLDFIRRVKADSSAIIKHKSERIIIKIVESKVETIQRMTELNYFISLRKEGKGFTARTSSLNVPIQFLPVSMSPEFTEESREFFNIKKSNVEKLFDDLTPLLNFESKYPLYGIISLERNERGLVTSTGFNGSETAFNIYGYFRAKNGEYTGQWAFSSTNFNEKEMKEAIEKANDYASITNKFDISDGKYDVVLSSLVMGNLMTYVAYMTSGFTIFTGNSMMKPGDVVGSEGFTLLDTPKEDRPNSWSFDDEGVETYNKSIIEKGIFKTPLLNIELSKVFNSRSTGNAGWIYPRAWNLEVPAGNEGLDSILSGNVILISNVWYTRFQNYVEGQFSTVTRDANIVYRNGNPVGVTGKIRIADTLKNIMRVEALSKERYSVRWWDAPMQGVYPFALVRGIKVTKA